MRTLTQKSTRARTRNRIPVICLWPPVIRLGTCVRIHVRHQLALNLVSFRALISLSHHAHCEIRGHKGYQRQKFTFSLSRVRALSFSRACCLSCVRAVSIVRACCLSVLRARRLSRACVLSVSCIRAVCLMHVRCLSRACELSLSCVRAVSLMRARYLL